jgi:cardiolipin synthase A/B
MEGSPSDYAVLDDVTEVVTTSIWSHFLTVGGFMLALFAIARLMSEKRQPGNTLAWLMGIILVPYVGVPLYLLLGGRKIKRLVARKDVMRLKLVGAPPVSEAVMNLPTTRTIISNGAGAPVSGNRLELLSSGEESYAKFVEEIRAAERTIHITTFILGRDETGKALVQELAAAAERGVKVRLLLDGLGSFIAAGRFCDPIRRAGGRVHRFMPVAPLSTRHSANLRNHRKIAVFDHHTAIVGGRNMAREYMGDGAWDGRWTDFGAVIRGPAAGLIDEVFFADWNHASEQPIDAMRQEASPPCPPSEGTGDLQVIASGPDVKGDPLYEGIVSFVQEAEQSIWIITPYFIPDEVLQRSLLVKARAGIDVTLIIPEKSNHAVTDFARRLYLRELQMAGARVLLYQPRMLHAKAVIMDDTLAVFGSANLDLRSLFVNFEIGIAVYSKGEVAAIKDWADQLRRDCRAYKAGETPRGWISSIAEDLSRLLAPLL